MKCQSCGSPDLKEFLDLGHHPPPAVFYPKRVEGPKTFYPLRLVLCDSCKLVQTDYATDPAVLFKDVVYSYNTAATASFKKHLEDFAQRMMRESRPEFVVSIGSNDGTDLEPYFKAGAKVLGIDPSVVAKRAKVPMLNDFFNEETARRIVGEHGQADLIFAADVFAHVKDVDSLMKGVKLLLAPDGVFVTESQYLVDMIEKLAYDCVFLEHLRYYSVGSISSLLERRGFYVAEAERIPTMGGSIRIFAKRGPNRHYDSSAVSLLQLESDVGLLDFETYKAFGLAVRQNKTELNALLWRLKNEGRRIVGIGAPARSGTILNYCGIGPDLLDYLVDVDPLKVGSFSPGMEIPIVDEERLLKDQPDYGLNLLWYSSGGVPSSLKERGYKGRFIAPLPEVKIEP